MRSFRNPRGHATSPASGGNASSLDDTLYDLKSTEAPRLKGQPLKALASLVEQPGVGAAIRAQMLQNLGFGPFREHVSTWAPAPQPVVPAQSEVSTSSLSDAEFASLCDAMGKPRSSAATAFSFPTLHAFERAYADKTSTPDAMASAFLTAHALSEREKPALRAFIDVDANDVRAQAAASSRRWREGAPRSVLDGIPLAVKDEVDQRGYVTTAGTSFFRAHGKATTDSTVVARLREKGAVLVGKTNMHELGIGVTGLNPHHGSARNPYDPACFTGGSSSGSASAVAAGLVPAAIGADGGGSIRIPAALCGIVGLKPTWSRVSEAGAVDLCWSVAHLGPMAGSAQDAAILFAAIAGDDPRDPHTLHRPKVDVRHLLPTAASGSANDEIVDLKGLKFGVFDPWFDDADPSVVAACRAGVDQLRALGAEIVSIEIPHLELFRLAHLVTIVSEMAASQMHDYEAHAKDYALDTRLNLALARGLTALDYVQAQRVRAHACAVFGEVLTGVDAILTPTVGCVSEPLPEDALALGESNLRLTSKIMRFAGPANLTGLPAISFPIGYDDNGLPIGLQAMGNAFDEGLLLKVAIASESFVSRRRPRVFQSPLDAQR